MDNKFIGFDLDALKKEVENNIVVKLFRSFAPDKESADYMEKTLRVFVNHGIDPVEAINILQELMAVYEQLKNSAINEEENKNE